MDNLIKNHVGASQVAKETPTKDVLQISKVVFNNGVRSYDDKHPYPMKFAPMADALWSLNAVKKNVIEAIKIFPVSIVWKLLRKKSLNKLLTSFNRIGMGLMEPYLYYRNWNQGDLGLHDVCRATGKMIEMFLAHYAVDREESHKTAVLLAHVVELDAFYRFKLLDIMNEANEQNMIHNPQKEVQRLIEICYNREQIIPTYIRPKLRILWWMAYILKFPSIKRSVQFAVKNTGLTRFKPDEIDTYWMLWRDDYHYFGRSPKKNKEILNNTKWTTSSKTTQNT